MDDMNEAWHNARGTIPFEDAWTAAATVPHRDNAMKTMFELGWKARNNLRPLPVTPEEVKDQPEQQGSAAYDAAWSEDTALRAQALAAAAETQRGRDAITVAHAAERFLKFLQGGNPAEGNPEPEPEGIQKSPSFDWAYYKDREVDWDAASPGNGLNRPPEPGSGLYEDLNTAGRYKEAPGFDRTSFTINMPKDFKFGDALISSLDEKGNMVINRVPAEKLYRKRNQARNARFGPRDE